MIQINSLARSLIFTLLATFSAGLSWGQLENNNWHFFLGRSLHFSQNPPLKAVSSIATEESSVAVSDRMGNLLFYTMGCRIWDRNGNEMPNATGLLGNGPLDTAGLPRGSSKRGVQVVRDLNDTNRYYVFSGDYLGASPRRLYWHLVDMRLNGGLGDVVLTGKNNLLMDNCTELMTVIKMDNCRGYWLLANSSTTGATGNIYAFRIDENGLNTTPVINVNAAVLPYNMLHEFVQTNDYGTLLSRNSDGLTVFNIDLNSGILSLQDTIHLDSVQRFAFSPDKSKLYTIHSMSAKQYDYTLLPDKAAFRASKVTIYTTASTGWLLRDLRVAPDGNLYGLTIQYAPPDMNLGYLANADQTAAPNSFDPNYMSLTDLWPNGMPQLSFSGAELGIPFEVISRDSARNPVIDTIICSGNNLTLSSSYAGASSYTWNTGQTSSGITANVPGRYWVKANYDCSEIVDSFELITVDFDLELPGDTTICEGAVVHLNVYDSAIAFYTWQDGSGTADMEAVASGKYYVTAGAGACIKTDTINIDVVKAVLNINQEDTSICASMPIIIEAQNTIASHYEWSNGMQGSKVSPDVSGLYVVTTTNICGAQSDSVYIEVNDCNCKIGFPNAFSPNGDGINDVFRPVLSGCYAESFHFSIYNRYGQVIFTTNQPGLGWDGFFKNRASEQGIYYYKAEFVDYYTRSSQSLSGSFSLLR